MFYQRLRDLREDKDLSQTEIANVIKTSQSYYAQYESGKRAIPFDRIIELANYYNVSIDYIAGRTNDKKGLTRSELSEKETALIKNYRELTEKQQGMILGRIETYQEENAEQIAKLKGAI